MKNRNRRVPPPPPPPPPPPVIAPATRSLPAPRPRRLDMPNFGTRSDQHRRAAQLPAPPRGRLESTFGPINRNPVPPRLPEPPENLREVLRDLTEKYARPAPAPDANSGAKPAQFGREKDSDKLFRVPVICTKFDLPFVLTFRDTRSVFGTRYKLDTTLTNIDEGSEASASASVTIPVSSLDWNEIKCPHCQAQCRPIRCGQCERLACDGRVTPDGDDTFFECAPSCGMGGWVRSALKTVTGSEGRRSVPSIAANPLVCAPATPPANVPKLPTPR